MQFCLVLSDMAAICDLIGEDGQKYRDIYESQKANITPARGTASGSAAP